MRINHILFLSPMNNELQRLIKKLSLAKDIRFLSEEQLIDTDLDWADAFVTFKTRAGYDYSRVKWFIR
ncbi:hypothetical protein JCM21714_2351 [Gracilibacillus boraciitolerans JCM 21714]|uniref:D-3-phosphoglycerate dehydrogenase n=1 Tax=Gracilibacillus boraciitolerans JCM 21714 TaxID=1298598 RepID=W4VJ90_9BACI|nr:hypothetical protein [Gracilibacillus boraciitolerans]GAE93282.1 hypothetical protein JCM21714_2351 [Gracilibacillus boraciitolerans JCM 21714]